VGHPITHQWPPLAQVGSMSDIIDITGQRFGRLTVVACSGRTKRGNTIWTCRCDCGNEKIVQASHLHSIVRLLAPGGLRQPRAEENRP
jgi:hypothetical protein